MAVGDAKILGYGGSASVDGKQVLISSGGFSKDVSVSYLEPYDLAPTSSSRSRVKHADGVEAYGGDLSCDVTDRFLDVLTASKLLKRRYKFDIGIDDGEDAYMMEDCYVTSLTISGAAGGLVTASLSFISASEHSSSVLVSNSYIGDDVPLGYWYSGNTDVREWSFSMNQDASPVYHNSNTMEPRYIKVGLVDYSLEVLALDGFQAHSVIDIKTRTFTLTGVTSSQNYSFGGVTEIGNYRHTFETSASASSGSDGVIIN